MRPVLSCFGDAVKPFRWLIGLAFLAVAVTRLGRYMGWW